MDLKLKKKFSIIDKYIGFVLCQLFITRKNIFSEEKRYESNSCFFVDDATDDADFVYYSDLLQLQTQEAFSP